MGFEQEYNPTTTAGEQSKWKLKDTESSKGQVGIKIISSSTDQRAKSNVRMGNSLDQKVITRRQDTSSASAYSPKSVLDHDPNQSAELTKLMRKTNFVLGFKSDLSHTRDNKVPRTITVISEEDEGPQSVVKNASSKFNAMQTKVDSFNKRLLKLNINAPHPSKLQNLPGLDQKRVSHINFGSGKQIQPKSTAQEAYQRKTGFQGYSTVSEKDQVPRNFKVVSLKSMKELQRRTNFNVGFDMNSQTKPVQRDQNEVLRKNIEYWKQRFENRFTMKTAADSNKSSIVMSETFSKTKLPQSVQRLNLKDHFKSQVGDTFTLENAGITQVNQNASQQLRIISKRLPNLMKMNLKLQTDSDTNYQTFTNQAQSSIKFSHSHNASNLKSHSHDVHGFNVHQQYTALLKPLSSLSPARPLLVQGQTLVQQQPLSHLFGQTRRHSQPPPLSFDIKRLHTPQFRVGAMGATKSALSQREKSDAYEVNEMGIMKNFHAYDHDKDVKLLETVKKEFSENKNAYAEAHFKLGYATTVGSQEKLKVESGLISQLKSESKDLYTKYDSSEYKYNPRCSTHQIELRKNAYNHFKQVPIAGQDSSYFSTTKQQMDGSLDRLAQVNSSYLPKRGEALNFSELKSPEPTTLDHSKSTKNQLEANFKLGYATQQTESRIIPTTMLSEQAQCIVQEAKYAYMMNNTNKIDHVRSAIHSSERQGRGTVSQGTMRSTNREFFRWIQPVPAGKK
ncbi:hypothetical protein FGO68_gene6794 [Halteria grandinella]|uniref:Uncharacterized protein n=1 Tax=Halteria grandinella TaxID=5974 RepID=A0A8J8P0A9_HALGN|nr:hypothetical protein FGO68_gene6794 [Halteria grandinella]